MSIGDAVRTKRDRLGMSQEELAARAGVSRSLIQSIENDRRPPRKSNLRKIATALGTDLDELMGDNADVPLSNLIAARRMLLEALELDNPEQMRDAVTAALAQLDESASGEQRVTG